MMLQVIAVSIAVILVPWFGYPLFMRGLARLLPTPLRRNPDHWPTVTVIVATRDPEAICERVANLLASDYPAGRLDVVVAIDALSTSATPIECPGGSSRLVAGDAPGGKASTLNAGVRHATGDVLVFADAAQRFPADAIRNLIIKLESSPRIGAVSGVLQLSQSSESTARVYRGYEAALREAEARIHSSIGVVGAIYALRRPLWEPLPTGLILDDVYVPMRVALSGHRVAIATDAIAEERRVHDLGQEYARKVRTLTGVFQLCAWLPSVLLPTRNPVWIQFVLHKLARFLTPFACLTLAVALVVELVQSVPAGDMARHGPPAMVLAAIILLVPRLRSQATRLTLWSVRMQAALVAATFNGFRSRWSVWQ